MLGSSEVTDLDILLERFTTHQIDTVFFTTALFNSVVENKLDILSKLDQVLFGGENSNHSNIRTAIDTFPELTLIHVYGPTETVVYSTFCNLTELSYTHISPIGKGLNNKKHYVLDTNGAPVPIGVVGELHIGGAGLARGYLNQPELTSERFYCKPLCEYFRSGERIHTFVQDWRFGTLAA